MEKSKREFNKPPKPIVGKHTNSIDADFAAMLEKERQDQRQQEQVDTKNVSGTQKVKHFSYECPGLHGPGTKQRIQPMTFAQLFEESGRLVIPLF